MRLPSQSSQYSSSASKAPLKHSFDAHEGILPHIKKFERDNRYDTLIDGDGITSSPTRLTSKKQAAITQSEKIFGPFRRVLSDEKAQNI